MKGVNMYIVEFRIIEEKKKGKKEGKEKSQENSRRNEFRKT